MTVQLFSIKLKQKINPFKNNLVSIWINHLKSYRLFNNVEYSNKCVQK